MKIKKDIKKKANKGKDLTKQLNDMLKKKEQHLFRAKELIEALPKQEVRYRKDRFIKLVEGNCYLNDVTYGIQILENNHGAPGKVITRIKTQEDFNKVLKTIKDHIKNYTPEWKKRDLKPDDEVFIGVRYKTRERLASFKHSKGDTYEGIINKALDALEKK